MEPIKLTKKIEADLATVLQITRKDKESANRFNGRVAKVVAAADPKAVAKLEAGTRQYLSQALAIDPAELGLEAAAEAPGADQAEANTQRLEDRAAVQEDAAAAPAASKPAKAEKAPKAPKAEKAPKPARINISSVIKEMAYSHPTISLTALHEKVKAQAPESKSPKSTTYTVRVDLINTMTALKKVGGLTKEGIAVLEKLAANKAK